MLKDNWRKSAKMIEAFVSGYAGSLIPFIEESFPEWFAIVTSLEKEDSHFHSSRHSYEVLPGSLLPYPHRPSMLIESPTHGVLVPGEND